MKYFLKNNKISSECPDSAIKAAYEQGFLVLDSEPLTFPMQIIEEGTDHEQTMILPLEATLEQTKSASKSKVSYIRESKKYKPEITYNGNSFHSDKNSVSLIESNINFHNILALSVLQTPWWNKNGINTLTTLSDLTSLGVVVSQRIFTEMEAARIVKNNIDSATTIEDIDVIVANYEQA